MQASREKSMTEDEPGAAGRAPASGNGTTVTPFRRLIHRAQYVLGMKTPGSLQETVAEAIQEHESAGGTPIPDEEKQLIRKVLAFNELEVSDVMTTRADIVAVEYGITLEDLKEVIIREVHTRLPVYRNTLDDIVGFIHAKDMLKVLATDEPFTMKAMMRQALFVPPSMMVSTLLMKMQMSRVHIALVVDEFGGTSGLVTLEDLMEEIVGNIEDEHDEDDATLLHKLGSSLYEANARISITELESKLGIALKSESDAEEYDTLGGLIFYMLGRIPSRGELAVHPSGIEFEIADADLRRIKRVLIRKKVK